MGPARLRPRRPVLPEGRPRTLQVGGGRHAGRQEPSRPRARLQRSRLTSDPALCPATLDSPSELITSTLPSIQWPRRPAPRAPTGPARRAESGARRGRGRRRGGAGPAGRPWSEAARGLALGRTEAPTGGPGLRALEDEQSRLSLAPEALSAPGSVCVSPTPGSVYAWSLARARRALGGPSRLSLSWTPPPPPARPDLELALLWN
uniref:Uncharacterized protein n=1 Tax=Rangifer tarandus platyrhynchus TaxID=3082113 RepID=A0ACB0EID9_RANTA|nr:unnamed protein product [Rangifer tarandus platyrhynchus]